MAFHYTEMSADVHAIHITPRESLTTEQWDVPLDTRVFIDFEFLRESIIFPRVLISNVGQYAQPDVDQKSKATLQRRKQGRRKLGILSRRFSKYSIRV